MDYAIHIVIIWEIYLILSLGLLIVMGWGGLFNLGQIALFAIGAYASTLISMDLGVNPWIAFLIAPLIASISALILGLISLRLSHDYYALGSLAFAMIVYAFLCNWKSLTRGVLGIPGIMRPELFGISFDDNFSYCMLTSFVALCTIGVMSLIRRVAFGRFLYCQGESAEQLSSVGVSPLKVRLLAFMIGASFAGMSGALYAWYMSFIDPTSFSISELIFVVSIVIIGGLSKVRNVIASSFFLVVLPEALRFTEVPDSVLGPLRQFLYAFILFLVMFYHRNSLFVASREV